MQGRAWANRHPAQRKAGNSTGPMPGGRLSCPGVMSGLRHSRYSRHSRHLRPSGYSLLPPRPRCWLRFWLLLFFWNGLRGPPWFLGLPPPGWFCLAFCRFGSGPPSRLPWASEISSSLISSHSASVRVRSGMASSSFRRWRGACPGLGAGAGFGFCSGLSFSFSVLMAVPCLSVGLAAGRHFAARCTSDPALARSSTVMALAMKLAASFKLDGMMSVLPALASCLNASI